ncbi:MAG: sugar ABC transporter permease [Oscillospiraceae bacterium]|nr:sugar ABC transporter permease [Oscillospiraceae bacterium]
MKNATLTLPKRRGNALERGKNRAGMLFILPSVILCAMFMLWPLTEVVRYSFTDWNGVNAEYNYVALKNYMEISKIDGFNEMMIATITFAIGTTILTVVISFITALALDKKGKGRINRGLMRSLWFLPALLSGTVVGMLWRIMYNFNNGMINKVLVSMGLEKINWLETRGLTNIAVIVGSTWVQIGMCVIVFMAGLQSIPQELYEAAAIDGAVPRQQLWHITLPMMASSITINVITTTIAGFKAYELPYNISKGMPGKSTLLMTQRIFFFGFQDFDYGLGSALSVFLLLIIAAISLIQLIYLKKREDIY